MGSPGIRQSDRCRRACLAAAALMLLPATGCQKDPIPEAAIQTVRAGIVEEIRADIPERYSATIVPLAQVDLAFKSAGLIERIYQVQGADGRTRDVQAGDLVPAGTELALVRQIDYQQRVQKAQEQVRQAEAQLAHDEAVLREAEQDYARAGNLYGLASLTKPEYEKAKARYESAKAQVDSARTAIETAHTGVSEADLMLSDTSLRAPFTGWLTARNVERGSLVTNTTTGFSLVDIHIVKAVFAVPDTSLKHIRAGQRLNVLLDALQRPFAGVVTAIAPQADPRTRVFSVELSIPNPQGEIRPGMIGSVTLGAGRRPSSRLVVPLSAVVRAPDNSSGFAVFRLQDRGGKSYASAQDVSIGETFGNSIEVTSGVRAGERIVGLGGELLRDGQEVRVVE